VRKTGIFIPGRLGSERLPNKLTLPLGDSCLWDIACKKLNELPDQYNKYALCYDEELVEIASKYENIKVIVRDKRTTEVDGPLTFIFKELEQVEDDYLMFLNPCLSLLSIDTILTSLTAFNFSHYDCATSVKRYQNWLWNKDHKPLTPIDYDRLSTKEIPVHMEAAHCFHIFNREEFFKTGNMLNQNLGLISVPSDELMDIDTPNDYQYASWVHENKL